MTQGFAFHAHHDVLAEWCSDYDKRVDSIKQNKPEAEIETRLRLFQLIPWERVPLALRESGAAYDKAWAALSKVWTAYIEGRATHDKAWAAHEYEKTNAAYEKAVAAYEKAVATYEKTWATCELELEVLHRELCPDCPFDGKTIFPLKEER